MSEDFRDGLERALSADYVLTTPLHPKDHEALVAAMVDSAADADSHPSTKRCPSDRA